MVENWTQSAFALLQQEHTDGEVASRLISAGCLPAVAEKLVAFIPLACGRTVLEDLGVKLSGSYRGMDQAGIVGGPQELASDPQWNAVAQFIAAQKSAGPDAVGLVAARSAEFDAVNKAMLNGSKPSNLVGSDPILLFLDPGSPSQIPKKPWWAFWRRRI
jgi:hypothetical protein